VASAKNERAFSSQEPLDGAEYFASLSMTTAHAAPALVESAMALSWYEYGTSPFPNEFF